MYLVRVSVIRQIVSSDIYLGLKLVTRLDRN
jgi:hypothetical protein